MPRAGTPSDEVFVVDDDADVREMLSAAFTQQGFRVTGFPDGPPFLAAARSRIPACVILDICMPSGSGLDVLKDIDARNYPAPIFVLSAHGDIPSAVDAIKNGAFDFFEKRSEARAIAARVREAVATRQQRPAEIEPLPLSFYGSEVLTPREREVLARITAASSSREIAGQLGISQRTVEIHRGHIMQKLGARNSIELVRIALGQSRV